MKPSGLAKFLQSPIRNAWIKRPIEVYLRKERRLYNRRLVTTIEVANLMPVKKRGVFRQFMQTLETLDYEAIYVENVFAHSGRLIEILVKQGYTTNDTQEPWSYFKLLERVEP